jgi:hypothetical protein
MTNTEKYRFAQNLHRMDGINRMLIITINPYFIRRRNERQDDEDRASDMFTALAAG